MKLTSKQLENIASYDAKCELIRFRVRSIIKGYITGLCVFGRGGTGKSHTILDELEKHKQPYHHWNSRVTGRGLFDCFAMAPAGTHVLEDTESLLKDEAALGVLRSATHAQPGKPRIITYPLKAKERPDPINFTGSITWVANREIVDGDPRLLAELEAIVTRFVVIEHTASNEELSAIMYREALKGYVLPTDKTQVMTPDECWQVIEYIVTTCQKSKILLNMRHMHRAFNDFLQCRMEGVPYKPLLLSTLIQGAPVAAQIRAASEQPTLNF